MHVLDRLAPLLARDESRDVDHRARAEQRDRGRDIGEGLRAHIHEHPPHARTFQLEHAMRISARQQLVGLGVVERDLLDADL